MTPIFNGLILDLSKQVFDQRSAIGEPDNQHTYTEALLALALNRACRDFLTALIEKETIEDIVKAVPEYIKEVLLLGTLGIVAQPTDAIKGISATDEIGASIMVYATPDKWESIRLGYNSEDVGTTVSRRWTEFGRQIYVIPIATLIRINYMYIKNHDDIVINVSSDILLNQRFFNQLLDLATAYIQKLSPVV